MKKVISLVLCLILLVMIPIVAHASIADNIQPDTNPRILGITDQDVPVYGTLPHQNSGDTIIIINPHAELVAPKQTQQAAATHDEEVVEENIELEEKDENATPATKEEVDEEVSLSGGTLIDQIFALTNKERKNHELKELEYNKDLQTAADLRARECAENFSHTRPDGSSCHTVVSDMDYEVTGENLVKADTPVASAANLMEAWMDSEGHRANILLPEFTSMAVGTYEKNGTTYAVQIFLG